MRTARAICRSCAACVRRMIASLYVSSGSLSFCLQPSCTQAALRLAPAAAYQCPAAKEGSKRGAAARSAASTNWPVPCPQRMRLVRNAMDRCVCREAGAVLWVRPCARYMRRSARRAELSVAPCAALPRFVLRRCRPCLATACTRAATRSPSRWASAPSARARRPPAQRARAAWRRLLTQTVRAPPRRAGCWLVAQLPQVVANHRRGSADALSPWFLVRAPPRAPPRDFRKPFACPRSCVHRLRLRSPRATRAGGVAAGRHVQPARLPAHWQPAANANLHCVRCGQLAARRSGIRNALLACRTCCSAYRRVCAPSRVEHAAAVGEHGSRHALALC